MNNLDNKPCVSCKEAIHAQASKCPHCQSSQNPPSTWSKATTILTNAGKLLVVFSLVFGVDKLNTLVNDVQQRREAVTELLAAARMQRDFLEHPSAWQLLEQARGLDASSENLRREQVLLAMDWVRFAWRQKGGANYNDILEPLLPSLQRGAISDIDHIAASALAHIGWANTLRSKDNPGKQYEIDRYFKTALEREPKNLYANVMRGQWLLLEQAREEGSLDAAIQHFHTAEALKQKPDWVRQSFFTALTSGFPDSRVDAVTIREANRLRTTGQELALNLKTRIVKKFRTAADKKAEVWLETVSKQISPAELVACYQWLSQDIDFVQDAPSNIPTGFHDYILGRLWEHAGDFEKAFDHYRGAADRLHRSSVLRIYDTGLKAAFIRIGKEDWLSEHPIN